MSSKFLTSSTANLADGSVAIFASSLAANNLDSGSALKVNSQKQLYTTDLDIADVSGLQAAIDSKLTNPALADLDMAGFSVNDTKLISGDGSLLLKSAVADVTNNIEVNNLETKLNKQINMNSQPIINISDSTTITSSSIGNGATNGGNLIFTGTNTGENKISIPTNKTDGLVITDGVSNLMSYQTTTGNQYAKFTVPLYVKESALLGVGGTFSSLDLQAPGVGTNYISMPSNRDQALRIWDGISDFITFTSTTGSELVILNKDLNANSFDITGATTISAGDGTAALPSYTFSSDTAAGMSRDTASGGLVFSTAGAEKVSIERDAAVLITHTATANNDHGLEIDYDAAGFGDGQALEVLYTTGALVTGQEDDAILVSVDKTASTGGEIIGYACLSTTGSAETYAVEVGVDVNPLIHLVGTFVNGSVGLVNAVDELSNFNNVGVNTNVFVNDDDTVTVGLTTTFSEIEFILTTGASGSGINPTFEYSTGVGTWQTFSPTDSTNGFRNTGIITFLAADVGSWAVSGSDYLIRITRTKNSVGITPVVSLVQVSAATVYHWDKNADIKINNLTTVGNLTVNGLIDTGDADTLSIAPANATKLELGASDIVTEVKGDLKLEESILITESLPVRIPDGVDSDGALIGYIEPLFSSSSTYIDPTITKTGRNYVRATGTGRKFAVSPESFTAGTTTDNYKMIIRFNSGVSSYVTVALQQGWTSGTSEMLGSNYIIVLIHASTLVISAQDAGLSGSETVNNLASISPVATGDYFEYRLVNNCADFEMYYHGQSLIADPPLSYKYTGISGSNTRWMIGDQGDASSSFDIDTIKSGLTVSDNIQVDGGISVGSDLTVTGDFIQPMPFIEAYHHLTSSSVTTTSGTINTPIALNVDTDMLTTNNQDITCSTAGIFTYTGSRSRVLNFSANSALSIDKASLIHMWIVSSNTTRYPSFAAHDSITFTTGSLPSSIVSFEYDPNVLNSDHIIQVNAMVEVDQNDTLTIYIASDTATTALSISHLNVTILGLPNVIT